MSYPTQKCAVCSFYTADGSQMVPPEGDMPKAKLVVLAEAPGAEEVRKGRPLIGPAGQELRRAAKYVGMDITQCLLLNAVNCRPPGNKTPTKRETDICRIYVDAILAGCETRKMLVLGDVAMKQYVLGATTQHFTVSKHRGYAYQSTSEDWEAFLTFHPSYIMRSKHFDQVSIEVWYRDLERAWKWATGEFEYEVGQDYRTTENPQLINIIFDKFEGPVAVDIETTGLDPKLDRILGVAFGIAKGHAVSVSFETLQNSPTLLAVLSDPNIAKVFSNGKFDLEFLTDKGIEVDGYRFDTRYAQHVTIPDAPDHLQTGSLRFMNSIYTAMPPYKSEFSTFYEGQIPTDPNEIHRLACMDVDSTLQIYEHLRQELADDKLEHYFYDVLMPIIPALVNMELRGVKLDVDWLKQLDRELAPEIAGIEYKYADINLRSSAQVGQHLHDAGFNLSTTPSGAWKVDEATLKKHEERSEFIADLLKYRELTKLSTTYAKNLLSRVRSGRIHCSFDPVGTATGRLSASEPNLQNQPPRLRRAFVPSPGFQWCKADYSQIELHIAGLVYDEPKLLDDLADGVDVHGKIAALCGISRRSAKTVVFGVLYGRTPRAIAVAYNVSIAEATRWANAVLAAYPNIRVAQQRIIEEARVSGYVTTAFGNRRATSEPLKIINHPIQGGAAGVLNRAMAKLNATDIRMLITVHDELDFEVRDARDVETIAQVMSAPVAEYDGYRFPVTVKLGTSWEDVG